MSLFIPFASILRNVLHCYNHPEILRIYFFYFFTEYFGCRASSMQLMPCVITHWALQHMSGHYNENTIISETSNDFTTELLNHFSSALLRLCVCHVV